MVLADAGAVGGVVVSVIWRETQHDQTGLANVPAKPTDETSGYRVIIAEGS
jgi:hypothetical protein